LIDISSAALFCFFFLKFLLFSCFPRFISMTCQHLPAAPLHFDSQCLPSLLPPNLLVVSFLSQYFFFPSAQQPPVGHGRLIIEASLSHAGSPQSVGLPWTSDQPDAETSTSQHATFTRHRHPCPQWDSNPQSQQASGRRPTP
jgi:hypothetical protein